MSYVFDRLRSVWYGHIRQLLVRDGKEMIAMEFEAALEEIHSANHELGDAINASPRVNRAVRELEDQVKITEAVSEGKIPPPCPRCSLPTNPDGEDAYACPSCKERWVI